MDGNTFPSYGEPAESPGSSRYTSSDAFTNSSIPTYTGSPMRRTLGEPSGNTDASSDMSYYYLPSTSNTYDQAQYAPDKSTDHAPSYNTSQARPTPVSLGWDCTQWAVIDFYNLIVPEKGTSSKEPVLKLDARYPDTPSTPRIVYLDISAKVSKHDHACMFPGESCWKTGARSAFGRSADLMRHYVHLHAPRPEEIKCDYDKCTRATDPFTRKDHYRDHLRDYHKEDLPSPKGKMQWTPESRRISAKWWRCFKCLRRVSVATDGWKCCGLECEPSRQKARVGNVIGFDQMEAEHLESVPESPNSVANSYTTSQSFNSRSTYSDYNTGSMMPSQSQTTSYWPKYD